jgi:hypothetical protein
MVSRRRTDSSGEKATIGSPGRAEESNAARRPLPV